MSLLLTLILLGLLIGGIVRAVTVTMNVHDGLHVKVNLARGTAFFERSFSQDALTVAGRAFRFPTRARSLRASFVDRDRYLSGAVRSGGAIAGVRFARWSLPERRP